MVLDVRYAYIPVLRFRYSYIPSSYTVGERLTSSGPSTILRHTVERGRTHRRSRFIFLTLQVVS